MLGGQRPAVHLVAEQGLGMEGARHVEPDVVLAVGCLERGVVEGGRSVPSGRGQARWPSARSASRAPAQCTTSLQPSMQRSSVVISTLGNALISVERERARRRSPADPKTRSLHRAGSRFASSPIEPLTRGIRAADRGKLRREARRRGTRPRRHLLVELQHAAKRPGQPAVARSA